MPQPTNLSSPLRVTKRMTLGIMLSLVVWGIYLAIGATGIFVERSLLDARKSGIVILFVALFVGLWAVVLKGGPRHQPKASELDKAENDPAKPRPWNLAGLITVALTALGIACWFAATITWESAALTATTILGWCAALLLIGSVTAGIVALSDRSNRRAKWLGLIGLIACISSLVIFVARMTS